MRMFYRGVPCLTPAHHPASKVMSSTQPEAGTMPARTERTPAPPEAPVWELESRAGRHHPLRPVEADADTLILLPLSGAQPTWRDLLLASSRSKMTRCRQRRANGLEQNLKRPTPAGIIRFSQESDVPLRSLLLSSWGSINEAAPAPRGECVSDTGSTRTSRRRTIAAVYTALHARVDWRSFPAR